MVERCGGVFVVSREYGIDGEGQQMIGAETHIDGAQVLHAAHEEPGAEEQQHAEPDLDPDEDFLHPGLARCCGAHLLLQGSGQVGTPEFHRRHQAEHQAGQNANDEIEGKDAQVKARTEGMQVRIAEHALDQHAGQFGSQRQSQQAAADTQQHALHQKLLHDATALRAQRVTYRHLARSPGSAHQQQAGKIGTGDDDDQHHHAHDDEQRCAYLVAQGREAAAGVEQRDL